MAKKVLFVNQEITPYVPDTEMAVMGSLMPHKIQDLGYEIRTFMPKWGSINERRGQLHEVIRLSGMNLIIEDTDHPLIIKVASIPTSRIQVYFIDNEDYFPKRKSGEMAIEYTLSNNGERAIFFARGVLETVKKLRWNPDLIVCQGWMSSLLPMYLKKAYKDEPSFATTKIATIIYGKNPKNALDTTLKHAIEYKNIGAKDLEDYKQPVDYKELQKMAIDYSDMVMIGSEKINTTLAKHIAKLEIPIMEYKGEETANECATIIDNALKDEG